MHLKSLIAFRNSQKPDLLNFFPKPILIPWLSLKNKDEFIRQVNEHRNKIKAVV